MAQISLKKVNKIYGGKTHAIHDLTFDIEKNDFVVLVGPSGCGKSTVLRMIAGLEEVSFGELVIDGELMNDIPPRERGIAMVFQNYALFPHMTVYENIAFGLKLQKIDREQVRARVLEAANILDIGNLLSRKPAQLSGGQKQRVALGRAIVCKPRIFLLDEPLSNLDAKLRASMRVELVKLYNKLQTIFVYVTHDQTEALTMATKIVVLKDGALQQADAPSQIYDYPSNRFVAQFIGSPQIDLFSVVLERGKEGLVARFRNGDMLPFPKEIEERIFKNNVVGEEVVLGIRPENLILCEEGEKGEITAKTDYIETLGSSVVLGLETEGALTPTTAILGGRESVPIGTTVQLTTDGYLIQLFDKNSGVSLLDVPKTNRFRGSVTLSEGVLQLSFGGTKIPLNKYDCLLDDSILDGREIVVELPSTEPTMSGEEGVFSLQADIRFIKKQHTRTVVYSAVGTEKFVFSCPPEHTYHVGGRAKFFFREEDVRLLDEAGNSLLSRHPTRGRFVPLSEKKFDFQKGLRILEDEFVGDGYLLYCGDEENYRVVKVDSSYPAYFNERVKIKREETEPKSERAEAASE